VNIDRCDYGLQIVLSGDIFILFNSILLVTICNAVKETFNIFFWESVPESGQEITLSAVIALLPIN